MTHARFSGFEARPTGDVADEQHGEYRRAVAVMEDVYHAERGGVARTPGGAPGEIEFYPLEAGADDLIDQFGIAGPAEYCAERLREIAALGIARIYIGTRAVGVDLAERNADRIGAGGAARERRCGSSATRSRARAGGAVRARGAQRSARIRRRRASICARWVSVREVAELPPRERVEELGVEAELAAEREQPLGERVRALDLADGDERGDEPPRADRERLSPFGGCPGRGRRRGRLPRP